MKRKILTAVALIVGLAALSSISFPSVASAVKPPVTDTVSVAPVTGVLHVEAGATGQGPATDEDCKDYASTINEFRQGAAAAKGELPWGDIDYDRAADLDEAADAVEGQAEDDGCFIVH